MNTLTGVFVQTMHIVFPLWLFYGLPLRERYPGAKLRSVIGEYCH